MTNQERNIRTLISCFVIALVALVPLRVLESQSYVNENQMVLGEEMEVTEEEMVEEEPVVEEDYVEEEVFENSEMVEEEPIVEEDYIEENEMFLEEEPEVVQEEVIEDGFELPNAEVLE